MLSFGVILAALSMLFAVGSDLVFKLVRTRHAVHTGSFVAGIGLVWTAVFAVAFLANGGPGHWTGWGFALLSGVASATANLLLIESLGGVDVGIGSTIYRLNLVWVMLLSFLFLHEIVTGTKLSALLLGLAAILLLAVAERGFTSAGLLQRGMVALLAASLLRALMGIFYKLALGSGMGQYELLIISGACWIVAGAVAAWRHRPVREIVAARRWILLSGTLVCGIVFFLSRALAVTDASVAVPISQFNFVGTALLGMIVFNEPLTLRKGLGLAAAGGAILLLVIV